MFKCAPMQHAASGDWDWCHGGIDVFRPAPISVVNSPYISMFGKLPKNRSKALKESIRSPDEKNKQTNKTSQDVDNTHLIMVKCAPLLFACMAEKMCFAELQFQW